MVQAGMEYSNKYIEGLLQQCGNVTEFWVDFDTSLTYKNVHLDYEEHGACNNYQLHPTTTNLAAFKGRCINNIKNAWGNIKRHNHSFVLCSNIFLWYTCHEYEEAKRCCHGFLMISELLSNGLVK